MTFPSTGIEPAVLELGDPLPQFQGLLAADGKLYSSSSFDLAGQLVIVFVGNGCPSVKADGTEAFPYLKDADGALARACGALATPHAFVFDASRRLRYRGRLTDFRDPSRATTSDLTDAVEELQAEHEVGVPETQPIGCSIVW